MFALVDAPRSRCIACAAKEGVQRLMVTTGAHVDGMVVLGGTRGWALCAACRIRLEAVLRAGRKHGERVRNWNTPKEDG
jgi:hypothetical protein